MIKHTKVNVTTAGDPGTATGSGTTETIVNGYLERVEIVYEATAPGTTTVAIVEDGAAQQTLFARNANATSEPHYPRQVASDARATDGSKLEAAGAGTESWVGAPIPVCSKLTVNVGACNAIANAVVVHIYYNDGK